MSGEREERFLPPRRARNDKGRKRDAMNHTATREKKSLGVEGGLM
jgi:hypothetical protein